MIGQAGTLESNDILIIATLTDTGGIEIDLQSEVYIQYADKITEVIKRSCEDKGITNATVKATDRGALDSTIRARVYTAIERARG